MAGKAGEIEALDEALRTISEATGGVLFPAGRKPVNLAGLGRLIEGPEVASRRRVRAGEYPERFPVFLGLAIGFGVWASRVPWRRARLLGLAIALGGSSLAAVSTDARRAVEEGCQAYERGDAEAALKAFEAAIRKAPKEVLPRFDAGSVLFGLGRFEEAARHFEEAEGLAGDRFWKAKLAYARGNAEVSLGRFEEGISAYDVCLELSRTEPRVAAIRRDAEINRAFALDHLPPTPPTEEERTGGEQNSHEPRPDPAEDREDQQGPPAGSTGRSAGPTNNESSEETGAKSPEQQLDSALERIQEGKDRRSSRPLPGGKAEGDRKDW